MKLGSFKTLFAKTNDDMKGTGNEFAFPEDVNQKITTADKAFESIKSGDRIFVGTACATPKTLVAELEKGMNVKVGLSGDVKEIVVTF